MLNGLQNRRKRAAAAAARGAPRARRRPPLPLASMASQSASDAEMDTTPCHDDSTDTASPSTARTAMPVVLTEDELRAAHVARSRKFGRLGGRPAGIRDNTERFQPITKFFTLKPGQSKELPAVPSGPSSSCWDLVQRR